jgi:WD40 repeat protein
MNLVMVSLLALTGCVRQAVPTGRPPSAAAGTQTPPPTPGGSPASTEAPAPSQPGQTKLEPPPTHGGFFAFAFSPDGKTVAGGTGVVKTTLAGKTTQSGGEVVLWDAQTGQLKQTLGGHGETVNWLAYSQDGQTLASASKDNGIVKLWDTSTGQLQRTLTLQGKLASSSTGFWPLVALSPDGHTLFTVVGKTITMGNVTISEGGPLAGWDTQTGKARWTVPNSQVKALSLSPDGKVLAGYVEKVINRKLQPDGRVSGEYGDRHLAFWNAETGRVQRTLNPGNSSLIAMAFLPGGQTLATLDNRGVTLWIWQTGDVQREIWWDQERWAFSSFAFSPDGKTLARAWSDWVERWDVPTGKVQGVLTTKFPDTWYNVAFAPDLKRMAYSQSTGAWIRNLTGIK